MSDQKDTFFKYLTFTKDKIYSYLSVRRCKGTTNIWNTQEKSEKSRKKTVESRKKKAKSTKKEHRSAPSR